MKQKIVIKVHMTCDKCRSKALGLLPSKHGVERVGIEGDNRDRLAVVGDGLDAANLTACLRKKVAYAELVTVEVVGAQEKKPEPDTTVDPSGSSGITVDTTPWQAVPYSYPHGHCYPYNM